MKKTIFQIFCSILVSVISLQAQVSSKLQQAAATFSRDEQLKHATWSLLVTDASSGKTIFDQNSETGLAPASTLKVITSITAFETLGKDFRYTTAIGTDGNELFIQATGDPSFGSWRYAETKAEVILEKVRKGLASGGSVLPASLPHDTSNWDDESVPDGWIWQDIGNYYGAGAQLFNWRENQYDILLQSGSSIGTAVSVNATKPVMHGLRFTSLATAAAKGTGDNAYIYHAPGSNTVMIRGTIPVNENNFSISGSIHDPLKQFNAELGQPVIDLPGHLISSATKLVYLHRSPSFDSLNYWFMRKSINLYGEAFLKTMAAKQTGKGSRESGTRYVRNFWKQRGIDEASLQVIDGSGLSPQNRITTRSLVTALQFARSKSWFSSFYESLPVYNGMKLKSGSINGSRAFAGYHTAADGTTYVIAVIVNNYSGSSAAMVKKIFVLLDVLK